MHTLTHTHTHTRAHSRTHTHACRTSRGLQAAAAELRTLREAAGDAHALVDGLVLCLPCADVVGLPALAMGAKAAIAREGTTIRCSPAARG
jgi:hypothetical protein